MTDDGLTIEELARRASMTVRNIRAHQTRGLLPPPRLRGRTALYSGDHLARLQLIREMQADGFNLTAIKRLLAATRHGVGGEELLRFERLLMAPWGSEEPEVIEARDLMARFPNAGPDIAVRAERIGIVRPLKDGRVEIPSPSLLRAGEEIVALGLSLAHALEVIERVRDQTRGAARAFVALFIDDVWEPFREAGMPEERLPALHDALERLRALASDVLMAAFRMTMSEEVERAFAAQLQRLSPGGGDGSK